MTDDGTELEMVRDLGEAYEILRVLTTPLVALTVRDEERSNGLIANSAIRASLVPGRQTVANYVFKGHLTHRILADTGRYVLQVLSRVQWEEIWALGFRSGRDVPDKLEGLPFVESAESRIPILTRSYAWMECRVVNVMDAGPATFFMGRVHRIGQGTQDSVMDSAYFRAHMPDDWREIYRSKLEEAQEWAARMQEIDDRPWRELQDRARMEAGG